MVQLLAVVGPGIRVRVEMHQADGAVLLGIGAQDGVGDEVVAADGQRLRPARQDLAGVRGDDLRRAVRMAMMEAMP